MNYKVSKIGLINFWLYDDETFDFSDGKLLLRGTNGSGKSVTMQSFIPLILDGNKNPSRLDPFGSKDKRIEDYLLGSADSEQKDEATSYLFMEMYSSEKRKYQTIGIGLHARKGRTTDFWGFIIKDGRRIGQDILLYHSLTEKIPCTKKELRSRLGTDNILVESTKEYKEAVNKTIFGFPNLDMYDEFINLLLQLRSPKLSKDYKPTKLMEILSSVLQPLTEDDLRPLSEAIEEMDKTKETITKLKTDVKKIANLLITYNNYNETLLYKKAEDYINSTNNYKNDEKIVNNLKEEINDLENKIAENKKTIVDLKIRKENIEMQRANLDSRDLESKIQRVKQLDTEIKEENQSKEKIQNTLSNYINKRQDLENELKQINKEKEKEEIACDNLYKDIIDLSQEIKFTEAAIMLEKYKESQDTLKQIDPLKNRLNQYQNKLENIKQELEKKKILEEKQSELDTELNKQNKEYSKINENLQKSQESLFDEILNIKDKVAYIGQTNQIIKLSKEEIQNITSSFNPYSKSSYNLSKQKYLSLASKIKDSITDELYKIKNKITNQGQKITEIQTELNNLKQSKELEIVRDEEELNTIKYMQENGIKFAEFYKVIEFKDGINQNTKNKLESTLLSSGILNAFLVENLHQVKNIKGNFITSSKPCPKNLTKYFKPAHTNQLSDDFINNVLKSINIDKQGEVTLNENYFKNGFIQIQGSQYFQSIYIGILSRIKAKEEKIKQTQKKLDSENAILNNLKNLQTDKENELIILTNEEKSYPTNETLENIESTIEKFNVQLEIINRQKNETEEKFQNITEEIEELFKKLTILKKEINFALNLTTFEEVIQNTKLLINSISEFTLSLHTYYQYQERIIAKTEDMDDKQFMIDELNTNLNNISISLSKKEYEKADLNKTLNSHEYKNLSEQILKIDKELKEIEEKTAGLNHDLGIDENNLSTKNENLKEKIASQKIIEEITKLKEMFFKDEYSLHYVKKEPIDNIKLTAKKILSDLSSRKNTNLTNAKDNYSSAYYEYRMSLNDYHLTSQTIFEKDIIPNSIIDEDILKDLYENNKRADLCATYQGRTLNIYSLSKTLNEAIEENSQIISEQDRHLFEEILLKSVGAKIRERIESSKNWVKKINQIMKQMQQNSTLAFGLEWKSKSAESMEEIETKELVRIFQIDANMITKEDSNKLINHFRSKLKKETEMNSESQTYSSVIFDVLDYRNWFEFKMNYQMVGDTKKELTNKVFSRFSGGEKAKTMYIPLFAAVYAKLMSAKKDAPRIVALDEAFAGVDDSNIREMFGILSSLNLDYILTSQALWGDYDTINNLAIAELLRPNNANAVCVKRYRWNGKYREIITKKENDAISLF